MISLKIPVFEYGAILKGSQTIDAAIFVGSEFEYGAILKGSQTKAISACTEV